MMGTQDCLSLLMNNGITENQARHGACQIDAWLRKKDKQLKVVRKEVKEVYIKNESKSYKRSKTLQLS